MSDLYWKHGLYLTGECKCDACPFHNLCKKEQLACDEFVFWVNEAGTGHDMVKPVNPWPTKELYITVFGE